MKTRIDVIIKAMKSAVTCGSIPTNKAKTVQAHAATVGAFTANKARNGKLPQGTIKTEDWVSDDSSVNKKPSASFSYLKRKIGAVRKNATKVSMRTKNNQGDEDQGDVDIPQSLMEWESQQQ
ncbi:hypothetical protein F2Q68_00035354 [Brassica cretica]|uniref:Uncharacterized protein n=1 Tax=Brassica cretica TaxID=69181 RepID=A0A8S9H2P4_BRACR|nr:hypothetical protein F2Q68_00035354 [Brassica cretica]